MEQIKNLLPLLPPPDAKTTLVELQGKLEKKTLTGATLASHAKSLSELATSLVEMGLEPTAPVVTVAQQLSVTLRQCVPDTIFQDVCILNGSMCVVAVDGDAWSTFSCHAGCTNDKARKTELKGTINYSLEAASPASVESHITSFDYYEKIMTARGCGLTKDELAAKYEVHCVRILILP